MMDISLIVQAQAENPNILAEHFLGKKILPQQKNL